MNPPWRTLEPIAPAAFASVRLRAIFECCKWDPQVGDTSILAPFAMELERSAWKALASAAESLYSETMEAEAELLARPSLLRALGLPHPIHRLLLKHGWLPGQRGARAMRFDFHLAANGWRISEVNCDVPGGFIEGGGFARLMAEQYSDVEAAGNPSEALADTAEKLVGAQAFIAMVHATAYADDRQVMQHLIEVMGRRGMSSAPLAPDHIQWRDGRAWVHTAWEKRPIDLIVRFFPGEWLPNLPRASGWQKWFAPSVTPQINPAVALATQSKRFPLAWSEMRARLAEWKSLLPETIDPRDADLESGEWVIKAALGRVGEAVFIRGVASDRQFASAMRAARRRPEEWIAQRRFEAVPFESPEGPLFPVLGVFVIDGRAAGVYGRAARRPMIDGQARDLAILIRREAGSPIMAERGAAHAA